MPPKVNHINTDKYFYSTQLLSAKKEQNRRSDIKIGDNELHKLQQQIDFFRSDHGTEEIKNKVQNTQYYKTYYSHSHATLSAMRQDWNKQIIILEDKFLRQKMSMVDQIIISSNTDSKTIEFLSVKKNREDLCKPQLYNIPLSSHCDENLIQELRNAISIIEDEQLVTQNAMYNEYITAAIIHTIKTLESAYESQLNVVLAVQLEQNVDRSIVWGLPREKDGEEDFIYSSKSLNPNKTVHIPYKAIHKKLAESNWLMRGYTDSAPNYLLLHMLFVISDSVHTTAHEEKYEGGRAFIDLPIAYPLSLLSQTQHFTKASDFKQYVRAQEGKNGLYPHSVRGAHSENALVDFLKEERHIVDIVSCLQAKLQSKHGANHGFKVYAINLFLNSQKNICSWCEPLLYKLMTDTQDGSFLQLMRAKLSEKEFVISPNLQKPYISISVSAHELYESYCKPSLASDARVALDHASPKQYYSVDIKKIAAHIILSTPEAWIDASLDAMSEQHVSETSRVPFYTGFRSAQGAPNRLEQTLTGIDYQSLEYETPHCFDGIEVIGCDENILESISSLFM